ncbi:PP2C family protein-serine/threonine phosphatase [Cellulomonas soli]|uniref:PP2C family protein-serine/threonine phosphatase n=1 Tax=Cellulomonas soli TaxID=931535 RepID=UPI003F84CB6F
MTTRAGPSTASATGVARRARAWWRQMARRARGRQWPALRGSTGDLMIVDLRDRLAAHGRIPALPDGWRVESVVRSAHADAFSGDFVVATTHRSGGQLEVVVVDVSGKGQDAGVRSLQLSGAFGGLLGAMPREQFLPAANDYLLDQAWDEGFASAVHVAVDLCSGEFWVASAGHPPPVHLHAGSGTIEVLGTVGSPALGVVDELGCRGVTGRIEPGDTLMLYTDGLVDAPGLSLEQATDRLLGVAEEVLATRRGGAPAVLEGLRSDDSDDRALVLLRRD